MDLTEEWLERTERELKEGDVPESERHNVAVILWKKTVGTGNAKQEDIGTIRRWFKNRVDHHARKIGPIFIGSYYYDEYFWPLVIPMIYGEITWPKLVSLTGMPPRLGEKLSKSKFLIEYSTFYDHCSVYGEKIREFLRRPNASAFLRSGHDQLRAAIKLLNENDDNPHALEASRMATEIFLKAFIDMYIPLSVEKSKRLGHDLERCLDECKKLEATTRLDFLRRDLSVYPRMGARYEGNVYPRAILWKGYRMAQQMGSIVLTSFYFPSK